MKRMIIAAKQLNNIYDQNFYCNYTVTNSTWGADVEKLLESVGGVKAYLAIKDDRSQYGPKWYYLFPSMNAAGEFEEILREKDLLDFVKLSNVNPIKAFIDDGRTMIIY